MEALQEVVARQAEEISLLKNESTILRETLSRTSSDSSENSQDVISMAFLDKIALEKLKLRVPPMAEVQRLKILEESQLVTLTFEKAFELLKKDLFDGEEKMRNLKVDWEGVWKEMLENEEKVKKSGGQLRILTEKIEECESNIMAFEEEIKKGVKLTSSENWKHHERIMESTLGTLEALEVKREIIVKERETVQKEVDLLVGRNLILISKKEEIDNEIKGLKSTMSLVENAVECLEVALQWAEFTENLEPLAQMATFNSLVEKALQQVEDGCESTIFNIEVFCNLCEELTGDSEELTREEMEKQEKDFLDSKKSTLAALPLMEKDKQGVDKVQSQLEEKLAKKKEEAEKQEMALSALRGKIEEQNGKLCEIEFDISYLENKVSKKSWITWILEFFGIFGKDKFYSEKLEELREMRVMFEREFVILKENEEIFLKEKEECMKEISNLEMSIDEAKKNILQKVELVEGVYLGLLWAGILRSASPLTHLAAKFSYLDENIKSAQFLSQPSSSSSHHQPDGDQ